MQIKRFKIKHGAIYLFLILEKNAKLSLDKRVRVVSLFLNNNLEFVPLKYEYLSQLAANEDIQITSQAVRDLVEKWQMKGSVMTLCPAYPAGTAKISENDLGRLYGAVTARYNLDTAIYSR